MFYLIEQLFLLLLIAFVIGLFVGWTTHQTDNTQQ